VHGLRAMLSHLLEDVDGLGEQFSDEYKLGVLPCSIDMALEDMHPNETAPC
jgi:lantibiotic modifying enzyme